MIEQECRKYIKKQGQLQPGQVFVSAPGLLPCKKVLHAVGPIWEGGNNNEEQTLRDAVYESMLSAEQCGLSSIALPALGGGTSGYPLDECTNTIVTTVKDFLEGHKQTCVKKVYLVDQTDDVVAAFHKSLRAVLTSPQRMTTSSHSERESTSGKHIYYCVSLRHLRYFSNKCICVVQGPLLVTRLL